MKEPTKLREVTWIRHSTCVGHLRSVSPLRIMHACSSSIIARLHRVINSCTSRLPRFVMPVAVALIALSYIAFYTHGRSVAVTPAKDNSHCLVCHLDFESELIAAKHVAKKITCAYCHGPSELHMSDEMAITKPDILFGRAEVAPFCRKCHKKHKNPHAVEAFRSRWLGKFRPNGRVIRKEAICTDCHGRHVILRATPAKQREKPKRK